MGRVDTLDVVDVVEVEEAEGWGEGGGAGGGGVGCGLGIHGVVYGRELVRGGDFSIEVCQCCRPRSGIPYVMLWFLFTDKGLIDLD